MNIREFARSQACAWKIRRGRRTLLDAPADEPDETRREDWGESPQDLSGFCLRCFRYFDHFGLPHPRLLRALLTDAPAAVLICAGPWDVAHIDGNHDSALAQEDGSHAPKGVRVGEVVALDDAGRTARCERSLFATTNPPGPSPLARGIDGGHFREILPVRHNRVFQRIS